jgi:hypothetical protein
MSSFVTLFYYGSGIVKAKSYGFYGSGSATLWYFLHDNKRLLNINLHLFRIFELLSQVPELLVNILRLLAAAADGRLVRLPLLRNAAQHHQPLGQRAHQAAHGGAAVQRPRRRVAVDFCAVAGAAVVVSGLSVVEKAEAATPGGSGMWAVPYHIKAVVLTKKNPVGDNS